MRDRQICGFLAIISFLLLLVTPVEGNDFVEVSGGVSDTNQLDSQDVYLTQGMYNLRVEFYWSGVTHTGDETWAGMNISTQSGNAIASATSVAGDAYIIYYPQNYIEIVNVTGVVGVSTNDTYRFVFWIVMDLIDKSASATIHVILGPRNVTYVQKPGIAVELLASLAIVIGGITVMGVTVTIIRYVRKD